MAKNKKAAPIANTYPKVIETFRPVGENEIKGFGVNNDNPFCFNGRVAIKRYRVTVEIIEEPVSVYGERLEKLWVESCNHHDWRPLKAAAAEIGYVFKSPVGSKRK